MNLWKMFKSNIKNTLNIDSKVLDLIALRPIFVKSLSGYSNYRIAQSTKTDLDYVVQSLREFLNFRGWDNDLGFNPIALFNLNKRNLQYYREDIMTRTGIANIKFIDKTFYLCRDFYNLDKEINNYYE